MLGNADLVVQMASDGRLGFVKHAGELEAIPTIEAITGLMERWTRNPRCGARAAVCAPMLSMDGSSRDALQTLGTESWHDRLKAARALTSSARPEDLQALQAALASETVSYVKKKSCWSPGIRRVGRDIEESSGDRCRTHFRQA